MDKRLLNLYSPAAAIVVAVAALTLWSVYAVVCDNKLHVYAENNILENAQVLLLAVAMVVYLLKAVLSKRSARLIAIFCSVLCLSFLLRELDVERLDVSDWIILIGSGVGRAILMTTLFLLIIIYGSLHFTYYKNLSMNFVRSASGKALIAGGGFLILGGVMERAFAFLEYYVLYEELGEMWGYTLILVSAICVGEFLAISAKGKEQARR